MNSGRLTSSSRGSKRGRGSRRTSLHTLRALQTLRLVLRRPSPARTVLIREGMVQSNTAKELTKLGGVIQVPFREGNQFLGEGGVQDIFYGVVRPLPSCTRVATPADYVGLNSERRRASSRTTTPTSPRRSRDPSSNICRSSALSSRRTSRTSSRTLASSRLPLPRRGSCLPR
jgi:hypothetical protein